MGYSSLRTRSRKAGVALVVGGDGCGVLDEASVISSCLMGVPGTGVEGCETAEFTPGMLSYCLQLAPTIEGREVCMLVMGGNRGDGNGLLVCDIGRRVSAPDMTCGGCIGPGDAAGRKRGTTDCCATKSCCAESGLGCQCEAPGGKW